MLNEDDSKTSSFVSNNESIDILHAGDNTANLMTIDSKITLSGIDLHVRHGEFIAIIGDVGAGKSSFISSLIGDTLYVDHETLQLFRDHKIMEAKSEAEKETAMKFNQEIYDKFEQCRQRNVGFSQHKVHLEGSVSLVEQTPWILNETLRSNILFGETLHEERYNETIELCQLARDLEILEGGDLTQIGEKGINLSGGQKARLSIARAVYADKDIVLMDDPLSSLDAHVKRKIFEDICCEKLKHKTRILVTHAVDFLDRVDRIIVMQKG